MPFGPVRQLDPASMSEVTDRGLSFAEAMNGKFGADRKALSIFDRLRVRKWWTDELPRMFSEIPAEWLPEMRAQATGTGGCESHGRNREARRS